MSDADPPTYGDIITEIDDPSLPVVCPCGRFFTDYPDYRRHMNGSHKALADIVLTRHEVRIWSYGSEVHAAVDGRRIPVSTET